MPERHTSPLELLWDLVFVFAITQVTFLLYHHLDWIGFARSMLVLALVWWAWSAFVWASNAQAENSAVLRAILLAATLSIFVTGLAVPAAFGGEATLFAVSYAIVRGLHLALYADASRRGNAEWSAIAGFAITVLVGMALLIAGSFTSPTPRAILWLAAVAIDYAGPAWITRERLRSLQRVAVAHFAERYGLFVLICLGESVVTIGVGARGQPLSTSLAVAAALGMLITIGMWWTYFSRSAAAAERSLREHHDPVIAAADAYSYLHLVIVAGIIVLAVGLNTLVHSPSPPLPVGSRLALCGGPVLYLLGHLAFEMRIGMRPSYEKLAAAAALAILFALGGSLAAWASAAFIAGVIAALALAETLV